MLNFSANRVMCKGRLCLGRMFLIEERHTEGDEIESQLVLAEAYAEWIEQNIMELEHLLWREHIIYTRSSVGRLRNVFGFGYTENEVKVQIVPNGGKPHGPDRNAVGLPANSSTIGLRRHLRKPTTRCLTRLDRRL